VELIVRLLIIQGHTGDRVDDHIASGEGTELLHRVVQNALEAGGAREASVLCFDKLATVLVMLTLGRGFGCGGHQLRFGKRFPLRRPNLHVPLTLHAKQLSGHEEERDREWEEDARLENESELPAKATVYHGTGTDIAKHDANRDCCL
jgi:hypothetical protein